MKFKQTIPPESYLIEVLQKGFSNEMGREVSLSLLSEIIASKDLITRCLREKQAFSKFTIDKIEKVLRENLSNNNLKKALIAINEYKIVKGYKTKGDAPNQAEIDLIESLQEIFSNNLGEFIPLSNLSRMISSKDTISKALRKEYTFKKFTTDKMEEASKEKLTGDDQKRALKAINDYRIIKGYKLNSRALNQAEIDLVMILQETLSNELKKPISIASLSEMITSRRFINKALERKGKFTRYSINKIKEFIEKNLSGINQERSLDSLEEYSILKGFKIEEIAPNQPEIELIEILQSAFSNEFNEYINYSKLSRLILLSKDFLYTSFARKSVFSKATVDKMEEAVVQNLSEANLEIGLDAIDEYRRLKRYKVVHPISQHPDPILSKNCLKLLIKFPKLTSYLTKITTVGPSQKVFKNYDIQPRISKFRIKGIKSKDREQIVRKLKALGLIKEVFYKSCHKKKLKENEEIYKILCDLMIYAQPNLYKNNDLSAYSLLPTHESITIKIVQNYKNCAGIEIPIWKPISKKLYLTGHPDILLLWKNNIVIADYKPSVLTSRGTLKRRFFHSLPQICFYGLLFKQNFDIKRIRCISFNHFKAWLYNPELLLLRLNEILIKYNKNVGMPWKTYQNLEKI